MQTTGRELSKHIFTTINVGLLLCGTLSACGSGPHTHKMTLAHNDSSAAMSEAQPPLDPASPWPKFRGNLPQTGRTEFKPNSTANGALWRFHTGKGIFSSPVVDGEGTIYIGSADRTFYAIAPNGQLKWKYQTGEIIDSAALLDDMGRVYVGSGDGFLRAFNRTTGELLWTMPADAPQTVHSYINWFEGNVGITPDGILIAPNDNFGIYGVARADGRKLWRQPMNDQVWSLPAVDPVTRHLYVGDNFIAGLDAIGWFYKNIAAIDRSGKRFWRQSVAGSVAASPMLVGNRVIYASFDGYVRAFAKNDGRLLWQFATRDHLYASPALLSDGTIIQPGVDGTVYAIDSTTGLLRWTFDSLEPIRSSPAVDGYDRIYFGSGDGRLYVLNPDGSRRFSMQLITDPRNDLNSSAALGREAIYIGGENGDLYSIPYDYCLKPEALGDARCEVNPRSDLPTDEVHLYFVTPLGSYREVTTKTVIDDGQPLTFVLVVREQGATQLAMIDDATLTIALQPLNNSVTSHISGDHRFVTLVPQKDYSGSDLTLTLSGNYLKDPIRHGLRYAGGKLGGRFHRQFHFGVSHGSSSNEQFALQIPHTAGEPAGSFELWRFSVPIPTILPSYNQIGFDSLHYLVGMVAGTPERAIGWVIGGLPSDDGVARPDPATKVLFPVEVSYHNGMLTMNNEAGFVVNAMNFDMPFEQFRLSAQISSAGEALTPPVVFAKANCNKVPTYGAFLIKLGFCSAQTAELAIFGSYNVRPNPHGAGTLTSAMVGKVTMSFQRNPWRPWDFLIDAKIDGSTLDLGAHTLSILVVDSTTGRPVPLQYGLGTRRQVMAGGKTANVQLAAPSHLLPPSARVYLMIDTYPAAVGNLHFPGGIFSVTDN